MKFPAQIQFDIAVLEINTIGVLMNSHKAVFNIDVRVHLYHNIT